ncbi:hypothetical protein [Algoriphagus sp.]|uniref:hypothetical protein n=1 Tax=Algoriphagus sp. TaxID=1872435 RepID=UPI003F70B35E
MKFFYLSSNPNDEEAYVIHERECGDMPGIYERDYLGPYNSGQEALRKASSLKHNVKLCEKCCKPQEYSVVSNIKDI